MSLLAEAPMLVTALRERSAVRARANNTEAGRLLEQRNRLAAVLSQRIPACEPRRARLPPLPGHREAGDERVSASPSSRGPSSRE
jgi:hypothetical protein